VWGKDGRKRYSHGEGTLVPQTLQGRLSIMPEGRGPEEGAMALTVDKGESTAMRGGFKIERKGTRPIQHRRERRREGGSAWRVVLSKGEGKKRQGEKAGVTRPERCRMRLERTFFFGKRKENLGCQCFHGMTEGKGAIWGTNGRIPNFLRKKKETRLGKRWRQSQSGEKKNTWTKQRKCLEIVSDTGYIGTTNDDKRGSGPSMRKRG